MWVKTYRIEYTEDGTTWIKYNGGQVLTGNTN